MKFPALVLLAALVAAGCASDSIARRKQERLAAYSSLPVSQQVAVDQGQLLHGMSTNAAYIAWGRPTEFVSEGPTNTWIYREQEFKEHKHTTIYTTERGVVVPEEVRIPYARSVIRATIIFENGSLTSWSRTPSSSGQLFR
jgi:hypothetical protein